MQVIFSFASFVFFCIGVLSMLTHAIKKWAAGEFEGSLIDWYRVHPRAAVNALLACVGGVAMAILSGALTDYTVGAQILAVWGIGFAADTINNQDNSK